MSDVPQDQKTMAMLSHVLGIFTGFVGALIIWLMNKDKPDAAFRAGGSTGQATATPSILLIPKCRNDPLNQDFFPFL